MYDYRSVNKPMLQLVSLITLVFGMKITIDVGYFGKTITNTKNCEIPRSDNSLQYLYYRKYGDGHELKPELIILKMLNVKSQEFEINESQNFLKEHPYRPEVLFFSYTRMLPSLSSLIPNCPFVTIDHDLQAENLFDTDNILMIHPFFMDRSTIYIMMDILDHNMKKIFTSHILMNLVIYIFNNSLCFGKPLIEIRKLIFELIHTKKVCLKFLNSKETFNILVKNTFCLIKKFHINSNKSYNDLITYFLRHLKRNLKTFLIENYDFKNDKSFVGQLNHLLFISVLDICNVVIGLCGNKFDYVNLSFFDEIDYSAIALERCLILEIKLYPLLNASRFIFTGIGDEHVDNLVFYQVDNSNKFIIGCNQIYNLYKKKIKLNIKVFNRLNIIEKTLDITEIIPNDNKNA